MAHVQVSNQAKTKKDIKQFPKYYLDHISNIFKENIKNHLEDLNLIDKKPKELWTEIK